MKQPVRLVEERPQTSEDGTVLFDGLGPAPQPIGGAAQGVSLTWRPSAGRPASSTSLAENIHPSVSLTTLSTSTLIPGLSCTGPIGSSGDTSRRERDR